MNELMPHIMEIKERLASIEVKMEDQAEIKSRVYEVEKEVLQAKTAVRVTKWILVVLVPTVAACAAKIFQILN